LYTFGKNLILAILVVWVGRKVIKWLEKILAKSLRRSNTDLGVLKFLMSMIDVASIVLLLICASQIMGFQNSSIAALVGSAGLTIGLALQGSLSNFAGGVLILLMKPFRIGDYIISNNNEGTVKSIDIFYTRLLTADNRLIVIPNGTLSNSSIVNVTNESSRRLDLSISVDYTENAEKVKAILYNIGNHHELKLEDSVVDVYISSFDPNAITYGIRIWVKREDYWTARWDILEKIKDEFEKNHVIIPISYLDSSVMNKPKNT
jgi:Small-conductance mechanosensitive channel